MTERKSELKVVWVVLAVISAKFLGFDFDMVFSQELADVATTTIEGIPIIEEEIKRVQADSSNSFAVILGILGVVYPACRTALKSITVWTEGQKQIKPTEE